MTNSLCAKIFLAEDRTALEDERFRRFQTFNFGSFYSQHKMPFAGLYGLSDETLGGGQSLQVQVPEHSLVILLPVVGAVNVNDNNGNEFLVNAGEVFSTFLKSGATVITCNPYSQELVNYIQLLIKCPAGQSESPAEICKFDLVKNKNEIVSIESSAHSTDEHVKISIGQFAGRREAFYNVTGSNKLFVFVIEGAFEVQGRLLHPRDGLALWNVKGPVEFEALSNDAIIMIMELQQKI